MLRECRGRPWFACPTTSDGRHTVVKKRVGSRVAQETDGDMARTSQRLRGVSATSDPLHLTSEADGERNVIASHIGMQNLYSLVRRTRGRSGDQWPVRCRMESRQDNPSLAPRRRPPISPWSRETGRNKPPVGRGPLVIHEFRISLSRSCTLRRGRELPHADAQLAPRRRSSPLRGQMSASRRTDNTPLT